MNQRQDFEAQIIERAWQEPAFKQSLLADPRAALTAAFGADLPPGLSLTVLEETPTHRYLVLPPPPPPLLAELALTDLDLALAGGGRTLRPGSSTTVYLTKGTDTPHRHAC